MHAYFMYIVGKTLIQTNLSFSRYTMSKIDLDRLIVRQTYFIPIESSQLMSKIKGELNASDPTIVGQTRWVLERVHGLSCHFTLNIKYAFLFDETYGMDLRKKKNIELAKEKLKEYSEKGAEAFYSKIKSIRPEIPADLYVSVIRKEKDGCLCKTECSSHLQNKLRFLENFKTSDFEMQTAYLESKRFLEMIFESGLTATLVIEEKKDLSRPTMEYLVNNISSDQIAKKIETMLNGAIGEILIFAWIGTILLKKLRELKEKGVEIKVITGNVKLVRQDLMRKEKELAMKELIQIVGKDHISIKPEFHGRAIIVDNKALIGSMDLDSYSLTGTRIEFATYTEDPEAVRNLRNYFNQIFTPLKE